MSFGAVWSQNTGHNLGYEYHPLILGIEDANDNEYPYQCMKLPSYYVRLITKNNGQIKKKRKRNPKIQFIVYYIHTHIHIHIKNERIEDVIKMLPGIIHSKSPQANISSKNAMLNLSVMEERY